MQQRVIKKLSVLAVLIISLCLTAVATPLQQASAAGTKCTARQFSTKSKADVCTGYIQRMLNINDGSVLAIDNNFGSKTKAEVKFYQTSQGIDHDGIVGPITWGKLCAQQAKYKSIALNAGCEMTATNTATSKNKTVVMKPVSLSKQRDANSGCDASAYRQGSKGACVKYIQQLFNTLGGSQKVLDDDGIYGPKTADVVTQWQKAFKLKGVTAGTLDSKTWDSLCFWDGNIPNAAKGASTNASQTVMNHWTAAAKKAGCNL